MIEATIYPWSATWWNHFNQSLRSGRNPEYTYDDVITLKHFPLYWPFVRGIHQSPVNSPRKGQWRVALMFSLICRNKRSCKQWWGSWFETPSRLLWRHCNATLSIYHSQVPPWLYVLMALTRSPQSQSGGRVTEIECTLHPILRY